LETNLEALKLAGHSSWQLPAQLRPPHFYVLVRFLSFLEKKALEEL